MTTGVSSTSVYMRSEMPAPTFALTPNVVRPSKVWTLSTNLDTDGSMSLKLSDISNTFLLTKENIMFRTLWKLVRKKHRSFNRNNVISNKSLFYYFVCLLMFLVNSFPFFIQIPESYFLDIGTIISLLQCQWQIVQYDINSTSNK